MLRNSPCLAYLDLSSFIMNAESANGLADGLSHNTTLRKLALSSDRISTGIGSIADALHSNSSLWSLSITGTGNDYDGEASVARMLTVNSTVENLNLYGVSYFGIQSFAALLPCMHGLKKLAFSIRGDSIERETEAMLVNALEQNTVLESVECFSFSLETRKNILYLLELNCGGRKILSSQCAVPPSLWPLVLARSSHKPGVLYFFLREKPDALVMHVSAQHDAFEEAPTRPN